MTSQHIDAVIKRIQQGHRDNLIISLVPHSPEFNKITDKYEVHYQNPLNLNLVCFAFLCGELDIYYSNEGKPNTYIEHKGQIKNFPVFRPVFLNFVKDSSSQVFTVETKQSLRKRKISFFDIEADDEYGTSLLYKKLDDLFNPMEMKL